MKSTSFIAVLLTLLMLLLVTGAAAWFLFQGRADFERDMQLQQTELEGHVQTINDLQTTAAAREMVIATGEAQAATRDAQLSESEALLATREAELEAALATTAAPEPKPTLATEPAGSDGPPRLEIINPLFGATVTTDATLPVIIIASAEEGMEQLELVVGDRPPVSETFSEGETYAVFRRSIFNLDPGALVITATLTTAEETESTSVRIFVQDAATETE